ncbi:MAG TPA: acetylglutamate kinase [Flavisolibacter sp.]|nr:acetylglutamate kinase [Flavisolibacter sp.]
MKERAVSIVKIGGNIIDDEAKLSEFINSFARVDGHKILIHGGGKLATRLAEQMNIPQQMVDGRRITDSETLKVVTMVYAGYINKTVVAQLQANNCNAIGMTGADGNMIRAHKRINKGVDYGFAGDIDEVNGKLMADLLEQGLTPVMAPITHDLNGQLLNTNADTIAQEMAKALSAYFEVSLIYSFEKNGVLRDVDDEQSVILQINPALYQQLKEQKAIFAGMIPKLDNAFSALNNGVKRVIIGKAESLHQLLEGKSGTTITNE